MKRYMMAAVVAMAMFTGCTCGTVDPGHVGIVVDMGGEGVLPEERGVGFYIVSPFKRVYEFPIFEQQQNWQGAEGFTFQTKEGLSVKAGMGVSYHIRPDRVSAVFQKYRRPIEDIQNVFLHNLVRDALVEVGSEMVVEDVYGPGKSELIKKVHTRVASELASLGIEVTKISLIGEFQLPDSVQRAINAKMEASQLAMKSQNELATAQAEAAKKEAAAQGEANSQVARAKAEAEAILVKAQAQAKANKLVADSLTQTLVEYEKIRTWNGQLPTTVLGGNSLISLTK